MKLIECSKWLVAAALTLMPLAKGDSFKAKYQESYRSIWRANAGKIHYLLSPNFLTTFRFPESGEVEKSAMVNVIRLADSPQCPASRGTFCTTLNLYWKPMAATTNRYW